MSFETEILELAQKATVLAGDRVFYMRKNLKEREIKQKDNRTFVTDADIASSEIFNSLLSKTGIPILDEERKEDGSRFNSEYCWFIDPLDSTSSFIKGEPYFVVLAGLTKNFVPIMGIMYNPSTKELYHAIRGQGAYKETMSGKIRLRLYPQPEMNLIISDTRNDLEMETFIRDTSPSNINMMAGTGSKTIEILRGNSNVYFCPGSLETHLWDVCAPQAILQELGGKVTDAYGKPIDYSRMETRNINGILLTANPGLHDHIIKNIKGRQI